MFPNEIKDLEAIFQRGNTEKNVLNEGLRPFIEGNASIDRDDRGVFALAAAWGRCADAWQVPRLVLFAQTHTCMRFQARRGPGSTHQQADVGELHVNFLCLGAAYPLQEL